jgi:hypothetical protein
MAYSPVEPRRQNSTLYRWAKDTAPLAVFSYHGIGVESLHTACAATLFTHYTPPPFVARIIP